MYYIIIRIINNTCRVSLHNLIVGVKEGEVDFEISISIWTKSSDDSRC